ncbi:MAG: hypothetical protein Kow0037_20630 [Calditrichia bacterium]
MEKTAPPKRGIGDLCIFRGAGKDNTFNFFAKRIICGISNNETKKLRTSEYVDINKNIKPAHN